jgi:hypothetical protein
MLPGEYRDFVGGSIECFGSSGEESGWIIAVGRRDDTFAPGGHMTANISANIEVMLRHALDDKCHKLRDIAGFDRMGLVLMNTYPFADDIDEVTSMLRAIIGEARGHQISILSFTSQTTSCT